MSNEPTLMRVATIGAPQGLRGLVRLRVHTDDPSGRLAAGATLRSDHGPLTVASLVRREPHWYASFEGYPDRTAVEALRGTVLLADPVSEPGAWYPHELVGLRAQAPDGRDLGTITGLKYYPAHEVLVLKETGGARTLIPFVSAIVPSVDVAGGCVVIDAPAGLLTDDADDADGADDANGADGVDDAEADRP